MYFEQLNALLFHPGKTAGTSVEKLLLPGNRDAGRCNPRILFGWDSERMCYLQHATARTAIEVLGGEIFECSLRFVTVRNPFSRVISVYHYAYPSHEKRYGGFRNFVLALPELVVQPASLRGNHYSPQYLYATLDDLPVCHHILYFENLGRGFLELARELGVDARLENLHPYRHSSFRSGPVADRFDDEMIRAMHGAYGRDFEFFGYPELPQGVV